MLVRTADGDLHVYSNTEEYKELFLKILESQVHEILNKQIIDSLNSELGNMVITEMSWVFHVPFVVATFTSAFPPKIWFFINSIFTIVSIHVIRKMCKLKAQKLREQISELDKLEF